MGIKIGDNNNIKNSEFIENGKSKDKTKKKFNILKHAVLPILITIIGGVVTAYIIRWFSL